jgi:hypothetical protein
MPARRSVSPIITTNSKAFCRGDQLSPYETSRQIFTDGRPLLSDPSPTWNGYSTGKWDGDTLVVQTNGLRDGLWLHVIGSPLTEAAKITERFRRLSFGQLEIQITVDDPKAYTKPWTVTLNQVIRLNTDLLDKIIIGERKRPSAHWRKISRARRALYLGALFL